MENKNIADLRPVDYRASEKSRTQDRMIGQNSAYHFFDRFDQEDVERYRSILKSKEVQKWMDGISNVSDKKIFKDLKEQGQLPKDAFLFAITGTTGVVNENEIGEVQGFVYVYPCENKLITDGKKRYEVGFAINPDAPRHQVASALRQICVEIERVRRDKTSEDLIPSLPIVAFADPSNIKSRRVLEAAGFEIAAKMPYDNKPDSEPIYYYELNWERLNKRTHEDADKVLFPDYKSVLKNIRKIKRLKKE